MTAALDTVVFYGSLLSGLIPRPGRPDLRQHVRRLGPCQFSGQLFDLGPYPGLISGDSQISGEVHQLLTREALPLLDAWEDYYPEDEANSEYLRREIKLRHPEQISWIYFYNRPTTNLPQVMNGDWRGYLQTRQG